MRVGQHYLANLLGLDASRLKAIGEPTCGLFPCAAGAGVDENVVAASFHEGNIYVEVDAIWTKSAAREEGLNLGLWDISG
jgi:hypothetical protein